MLRTLRRSLKRLAWTHQPVKGQRGQAILEAAFGLFFFIFIIIGVMELSVHALKFKRASTISREGVLVAWLDCSQSARFSAIFDSCLTNVRDEIEAIVPMFFNNYTGTVILSAYVDAGGFYQQLAVVGETAEYQTRYTAADIDISLLNAGHEVVIVSEFYNDNDPFTQMGNIPGFIPDFIYAATLA